MLIKDKVIHKICKINAMILGIWTMFTCILMFVKDMIRTRGNSLLFAQY